jgi:hypothetical protein
MLFIDYRIKYGLCQTAKIRLFGVFVVCEQLFFKKIKKTLAGKEISCTFAAAFGNG